MAGPGRPTRIAVLDRLDRSVDELMHVGGLPHPAEAEAIWEGIWYEETHNSTAIEGNTLILKEVKTLLDEGRAVGAKELREYLEVQGYAEAAQWVYGQAHAVGEWGASPAISASELREIHRRTVEPVWRHFPPAGQDPAEGPGSYRRHDIQPFAGGMAPPEWTSVSPLVTDWLESVGSLQREAEAWFANGMELHDPREHPISRLAELHAAFERIHPFRDGNGRAGRLALNLVLVRLAYPPAIIYKRDRSTYLRGLERADRGDPGPLAELIARAVIHGINRFLLPSLAGPHRMIPLTALADHELSLIALRRAAERSRLRALRRQDQWYSTRAWVEEYKASRRGGRRIVERERPAPRPPANRQLRLPPS